jgi:isoleucyl-tRNA synthetase
MPVIAGWMSVMFQPVEGNVKFPEQELTIGRFWKEHGIYEKSLAQRADAPSFVFYEGPPTANGMPHPGHCLTRAVKDLFPRYKTMRGYRCERKAGWDTHGLPVEVEVCKELGIHAKEEIEAYGIEPFIQKCQASVWRYMQEWQRLTERLGFWVDMDDAYVTYHQSYVESVWWSLKNLFDRGLLYQGHKIVWWWAQGGTALSAGEVGQGYRQVRDQSVYVKFPIILDEKAQGMGLNADTYLLIWTTTPWTLPSNQFVAINPELIYEFRRDDQTGETFLVAKDCWTELSKRKPEFDQGESLLVPGTELIGLRYEPPFDYYYRDHSEETAKLLDLGRTESPFAEVNLRRYYEKGGMKSETIEKLIEMHVQRTSEIVTDVLYWRVVAAPFVTTDSGTGLVHQAPAFGEDDSEVLGKEDLEFEPEFDQSIKMFVPVEPNGTFTSRVSEYAGRWVKDCDKDIIRNLKDRSLLFHQEPYDHEYPFCWRAEEDPLIQYPRKSWFIRTTEFKDEMLQNNSQINWLPEHIKDGRFGKFLESNVDWTLSRERFWGTPLPLWICDQCGRKEAIGSYQELIDRPDARGQDVWERAKQEEPRLPEDLKVHKPYIDAITYRCGCEHLKGVSCNGVMHRVPDVIDCWYDSGAMPFAQWGYRGEPPHPSPPHRGEGASGPQRFFDQFPADFISEALDQTRGWFYSQLAISTLLFGEAPGARRQAPGEEETSASQLAPSAYPYPHPFRNCIVLGLMLGEDGQKMSKSKRNYLAPDEIFDRYGADALRWYFFANQPPWTTIRYSEQAIKDSIPEFLLRLWNCYSFFVIYANIDGFDPGAEIGARFSPPLDGEGLGEGCSINADIFPLPSPPHKGEGAVPKSYRPIKERNELDRWILSELNRTAAVVVERMDAYDIYGACQRITEFVDALSNWYVRRSRDRFWAADKRAVEKLDAYWTLYECLVTTAKIVAPFVPFVADSLWHNLSSVFQQGAGGREQGVMESVHLCDYPTGDAVVVDEALSEQMDLVRLISSLGRNARSAASLKVRQPLAKVEVVLADTKHQAWLEEHAEVITEELNVKQLEFCDDPSLYVEHEVVPNFKLLGPKLGKLMPKVKKWLGEQSGAELLASIRDNGLVNLEVDGRAIALTREELEVRISPREGWTSANDRGVVVVLSTELTPELLAEGLARDLVRVIQDRRKEIACDYTDRIEVGLVTKSSELAAAIDEYRQFISEETLATNLLDRQVDGAEATEATLGGDELTIYVKVVK